MRGKEKVREMKAMKRVMALVTMALVILTMTGTGITAFAGSSGKVPDLPDGPYSMTVQMQRPNFNLEVYKVATLKVEDGYAVYTTVADFASCNVSYDNMTAAQSNEAAKKFAKCAKENNISGTSISTDSKGDAHLDDLEAGIYLVNPGEQEAGAYVNEIMLPFIVAVPGIDASGDDYEWITDVSLEPKAEISIVDVIETDPPVEKIVKGDPKEDATFTFELRADDITNPMPAGSRDGVKQVTLKGAGKTEFGSWQYTEPGTYKYTVKEINTGDSNYKYDDTVYHLTDKVSLKGKKLVLKRTLVDGNGNEVDGMAKFTFVNEYKPGSNPPGPNPKTGDYSNIIWLICMMAGAACIAIAIRRRRCD